MTSTSQERIPKRLIGAIVAVGSLAFIGILTETVMTVLFPELMTEFGVNTATVQWITTVYLLVVAATMPLSSFLNRRFRLKSLFIAAVVLALTGSAIMIVGHTFPVILLARVIQGIGSGVATPLMMNIILEQSPRSKVGRLMGVGSLVITVAPAIGPTVGGAVSSVCRGVPSSSSPFRSCCWSPCRSDCTASSRNAPPRTRGSTQCSSWQ